MVASGYVGGDPGKVSKTGDAMSGALTLPGDPVNATDAADKHYVDTHGGGGGATIHIDDTGLDTAGDITVASGGFTAVGRPLVVAASVGDKLTLEPECLVSNGSPDMQFEAATRLLGADVHYWSNNTGVTQWPGCRSRWYVNAGIFTSPGNAAYTVQNGDLDGSGNVTVQFYARVGSGSRGVNRNVNFPLRIRLVNEGQG